MKSLLFLLPLFCSLVSAQFLLSSSSVTSFTPLESKPCESRCPLVRCRTDDPGELCRCINNRELMCKKLCPFYNLSIRRCSRPNPFDPISVTPVPLPSPISVEFPSVEPVIPSVVTEIPEETLPPIVSLPGPDGILKPIVPCECEQVFCIQSFPDSCYCAAANALKCFEKCGGVRPPPANCPPRDNNINLFPDGPVKARSAAPEPQVAPEAELVDPVPSIPLAPNPVGAPNVQVPDNAGATQVIPFVPIPLIGEAPPLLDFPPGAVAAPGTAGPAPVAVPLPIVAPAPVSPIVGPTRPRPRPLPIAKPRPGCVCEQTVCLQSFPESCRCENVAAMKCFYKCGGVRPVLATCPPQFTPIKISKVYPSKVRPVPTRPAKTPRPLPIAQDVRPHRACGGFRVAGTADCPKGYFCMDDPFRTGCGMACDAPGICVRSENNFCGGFGGFRCTQAGKACVEDPRDTCDPTNGGADCGGVCVWEHPLT